MSYPLAAQAVYIDRLVYMDEFSRCNLQEHSSTTTTYLMVVSPCLLHWRAKRCNVVACGSLWTSNVGVNVSLIKSPNSQNAWKIRTLKNIFSFDDVALFCSTFDVSSSHHNPIMINQDRYSVCNDMDFGPPRSSFVNHSSCEVRSILCRHWSQYLSNL